MKLAPGLKTVEDATEIRRRVLLAFELAERQMVETGTHPPLNFVIIGGGPTGVELAGAISDIAKLYMTQGLPAYRYEEGAGADPGGVAAYSGGVSGGSAGEGAGATEGAGRAGADECAGHRMCSRAMWWWAGPSRIERVVTLWAAGVQASPLGKLMGLEVDKRGCVMVDGYLNPKGHPEIFICGDLAHVEQDGRQVPGVAQPAMQMGDYVAKRIGTADGEGLGSDGQASEGVPLLRQGRHGDDWAEGCGGEDLSGRSRRTGAGS